MALLAAVWADLFDAKTNPHLKKIIEQYGPPRPAHAAAAEIGTMMRFIRNDAQEGLKEFAGAEYYDYFHSTLDWNLSVAEQVKFRELLISALKDIEGDIPSYQRRL